MANQASPTTTRAKAVQDIIAPVQGLRLTGWRLVGLAVVVVALIGVGFFAGTFLSGGDSTRVLSGDIDSDSVESRVEDAYLSYWSTFTDAMKTLDPSGLSTSMDGAALQEIQRFVSAQKARGQPVLVEVEHDYRITTLGDVAYVYDSYVSTSEVLGAGTSPPSPSGDRIVRTFVLQRLDGTWKVIQIVRHPYVASSPL